MDNNKFMLISLCADEFSIDSVKSGFRQQFKDTIGDAYIKEIWTRYIVAMKDNDQGIPELYRVDYRVDDQDSSVVFGSPYQVDSEHKPITESAANKSEYESADNTTELTYSVLDKILRLSVLNAERRNKLKDSDFALPGRRYPIHDEAHGRSALQRVAQHGTPEEIRKVRAAVKKRYPNMKVSD